jgi:hypothetical protein
MAQARGRGAVGEDVAQMGVLSYRTTFGSIMGSARESGLVD